MTVTSGTVNQDRAALVTLYNATNGPNWSNSNNWLTDAPLEEWYGVTLDASGRVRELELSGNDLTGEIPPELGNLTDLLFLNIHADNLTGEIPPELGNLTNLQYLGLSSNDLTGEIPPGLGNLTNLQYLGLYSNDLTGEIPPELGNLTNLANVNLQSNDLTGKIPSELGNLTNLLTLSLQSNDLTGKIPSELGNLTNLGALSLYSNNLTGALPLELANLTNLRTFLYRDTRLCVPNDDSFRTWLNSISNHRGTGLDCQDTGAGMIFRDDFNNSSSLNNWQFNDGASPAVSGGILRLTNSTEVWAVATHSLSPPITAWEVRARMGASAESMRTALTFAPSDPGERDFRLGQLEIGRRVLIVDGEEQTVNYSFWALVTPEDRDLGWYFFTDFIGMSDAINDGVGDFTEIAVRLKDDKLEALAGGEMLFSHSLGTSSFLRSLTEIDEVQFWSLDAAAANPGLLDWIEVTGVPSGSSANADRDSRPRLAQPDFLRDLQAVQDVPKAVCLTRKCP